MFLNGRSKSKIKKQWDVIIPKLNVEEIPFRFVKEIKMVMTNGEILIATNKRQFDQKARESAENDIFIQKVSFTIDFDRLVNKVERIYDKVVRGK